MNLPKSTPMNTFGLEEIRAIRDRWVEMPLEEYRAEQEKLLASAMRRLGQTRKETAATPQA